MALLIAVDTGGTFTDLAAFDMKARLMVMRRGEFRKPNE